MPESTPRRKPAARGKTAARRVHEPGTDVTETAPEAAAAQAIEVPPGALPPPVELPSELEVTATDRFKQLAKGALEWVTTNLKIAIIFAALGLLISWIANIVIVAVVFEGVGRVAPGSAVVGQANLILGSLFWFLGMMVFFGLVGYGMQVGWTQFLQDVRSFPRAVGALLRGDGEATLAHILWGAAVALLVASLLSPSFSGLFAVGVLLLLAQVLRSLVVGMLMVAWRKVVSALSPKRTGPPSEAAFSVAMFGAVVGFALAYGIPSPGFKLLGAVGAGVAAYLVSQRRGSSKVTLLLLIVAGAALLAFGHDLLAWASDGGWRENGGDLGAWLQGGGTQVISDSGGAGIAGAGGALVGGGVGSHVGHRPRLSDAEMSDRIARSRKEAMDMARDTKIKLDHIGQGLPEIRQRLDQMHNDLAPPPDPNQPPPPASTAIPTAFDLSTPEGRTAALQYANSGQAGSASLDGLRRALDQYTNNNPGWQSSGDLRRLDRTLNGPGPQVSR